MSEPTQANSLFQTEQQKPTELKSTEKIEEIKSDFLQLNATDEYKRKRDEVTNALRKKGRSEQLKQKRGIKKSEDKDHSEPSSVTKMTFTAADIPRLAQSIHSCVENEVYYGVVGLRRLLATETASPIQEIIDAGTVPKLIDLIGIVDKPHIQFEAAWCLTNIATGTTEQTQCVIEKGAIPKFIALLLSTSDKIKDQAIWALGNISGENANCRNLVIKEGIIAPLVKLLEETQNANITKNGLWALSNLCRGKPAPQFEDIKCLIPTFARYIKDETCEKEALADCCWALSYLSDGGDKRIPYIIESGIISHLVRLLEHTNPAVSTPALRILGNIITGDDEQTQLVIASGCLIPMEKLLSSPKIAVRKETCWALSNITAGNAQQIEEVLKTGIFPRLIAIIKEDAAEVRREAVWALSNATSSSIPNQVYRMMDMGVVDVMCSLFTHSDARTISIALEGLENLLKKGKEMNTPNPVAVKIDECGGLRELENLQLHNNTFIYNKSLKILEDYFGMEDEPAAVQNEVPSIFKF